MRIGLESLIEEEMGAYVDEVRSFNAKRSASRDAEPPPDPSTPEGLETVRAEQTITPTSGPAPVQRLVAAAGRRVRVRVLAPQSDAPRGVHLDIHGGGFYMGQAGQRDAHNRRLADALQIAVVSVEYRLAPEHPCPAAPDDCETAALWLVDQAKAIFGTTRLAIGGVSAGATLAMTTLLRLRDRRLVDLFVGAVLQYGTYDISGQTPASRLLADEFFVHAYAGHVADRTTPDISPFYGDLRGLPPALLIVGSLDILLEDNLMMAARLSAAGGDLDVRVYPESPHGFTLHPTSMADAALRGMESWLADRLLDP
jgi:acetyl esterase